VDECGEAVEVGGRDRMKEGGVVDAAAAVVVKAAAAAVHNRRTHQQTIFELHCE
jgi:hypothetical protein